MKVIDNFLSSYQFKIVESTMMSPDFPWYFTDGINTIPEPQRYQFNHVFSHEGRNESAEFLPIFEPCIRQLGITNLRRIKANLNPRTFFHRSSGFHYDYTMGNHKKTISNLRIKYGLESVRGRRATVRRYLSTDVLFKNIYRLSVSFILRR